MSRLTRSEIDTLIDDLILAHPIYTPQLRAFREQSLSQEAVRDEALDAAAKMLIVWELRQERPSSGEMVMVPRELIDRAVLWFHTFAENGMDATFSDGERTPNAVAMDDIAAQFSALSAAEAEGRKS